MPELSNVTVPLVIDDKRYTKGLARAKDGLKKFGLAAIGTGAALGAATMAGLNQADSLQKMAVRTKTETRSLSVLSVMADMAGTDVANLEKGLNKMEKSAGDALRGIKAPADAFAELGINVRAFARLSPEKRLGTLANALNKVSNTAKRASIGNAILGKAYRSLTPLLDMGSAGMNRQSRELTRLGIGLDTNLANNAADALDAITKLQAVMSNFNMVLASSMGSSITDTINDGLGALPGILVAVKTSFVTVGAAIGGIAKGIVEALQGVGDAIVGAFAFLEGDISGGIQQFKLAFEHGKNAGNIFGQIGEHTSRAYNDTINAGVANVANAPTFGSDGVAKEGVTKKQGEEIITHLSWILDAYGQRQDDRHVFYGVAG